MVLGIEPAQGNLSKVTFRHAAGRGLRSPRATCCENAQRYQRPDRYTQISRRLIQSKHDLAPMPINVRPARKNHPETEQYVIRLVQFNLLSLLAVMMWLLVCIFHLNHKIV